MLLEPANRRHDWCECSHETDFFERITAVTAKVIQAGTVGAFSVVSMMPVLLFPSFGVGSLWGGNGNTFFLIVVIWIDMLHEI